MSAEGSFANGTDALWVSNTNRKRKVRIVTQMKTAPDYIVEIREGLPGEHGTHAVVPHCRLAVT